MTFSCLEEEKNNRRGEQGAPPGGSVERGLKKQQVTVVDVRADTCYSHWETSYHANSVCKTDRLPKQEKFLAGFI